MTKSARGKIGVAGFFALTGSMVATVYSYPAFASSGFALVFFLLLTGLLYFVPTALVSAEMATGQGWEDGGVYRWCGVAFGKRWGFFAIFMQWLQITIGFVTMLYFIVGALAYLFGLHIINTNPLYKFLVVVTAFWLITFINLRGTSFTAKFATVGFSAGIVLPALVIIGFAIAYVIGGHPVEVKMDAGTFLPDFTQINTLVILVAFMLSYLGIEASAVHVNSLRRPQRDYPIAILLLTVTAIVLNIFGALSIAIVVPAAEITMNAGILQAVEVLFGVYHIQWLVHVMAALLALGAVAEIGSWVVGPVHGMYVAAKDGLLPASLNRVNEKNVPERLVLIQGVFVTIWAAVLTFGGGGANLSYLLAMALTVITYLFMYVLLYLAYYKLRISHGDVKRAYLVPGGKFGRAVIPAIGLLMSLFALVISFFPPSQIAGENDGQYETILFISAAVVLLLPHLIYAFREDSRAEKFLFHHITRHMPRLYFAHPRGRHGFRVHPPVGTTECTPSCATAAPHPGWNTCEGSGEKSSGAPD